METTTKMSETLEPIRRLRRDLVVAASSLSIDEARYLVDAYYQIQEHRKATGNQVRALVETKEPHLVLQWLFAQNSTIENQIKRALDTWGDSIPAARWAKSICGIGPVISAGLAAHIDPTRSRTAGGIWRFAGLDPTVVWKPKTKRPWNASLKTLCWKIGDSFIKVSNNDADFYGKLYRQRKQTEIENNEAGKYADQAKSKLEHFNIRNAEIRAYYEAGKLPPGHVHARARRWVTKLFLSHYHEVAWTLATGTPPPKPFVIAILGHGDYIAPPNFPMQEVA
jgi:hypothetical protein